MKFIKTGEPSHGVSNEDANWKVFNPHDCKQRQPKPLWRILSYCVGWRFWLIIPVLEYFASRLHFYPWWSLMASSISRNFIHQVAQNRPPLDTDPPLHLCQFVETWEGKMSGNNFCVCLSKHSISPIIYVVSTNNNNLLVQTFLFIWYSRSLAGQHTRTRPEFAVCGTAVWYQQTHDGQQSNGQLLRWFRDTEFCKQDTPINLLVYLFSANSKCLN